MKMKKIELKKETVANLDLVEMNAIRGGFDLEDYASYYQDPGTNDC